MSSFTYSEGKVIALDFHLFLMLSFIFSGLTDNQKKSENPVFEKMKGKNLVLICHTADSTNPSLNT